MYTLGHWTEQYFFSEEGYSSPGLEEAATLKDG
jgi:hypothetical protein